MADSQEIRSIVEGVIAKVFEKRIAELRKDLHRGVGESLGSRVSELQLDVETGVSELFSSQAEQVRSQIGKSVADVLDNQLSDVRKDVERGVTDVINKRAAEIREHVQQGLGEVLNTRAGDLRKEIESTVSGIFEHRSGELQKEIERLVNETSRQRMHALKEEIENAVEGAAEKRVHELKSDVQRVVGEKADGRIEELRKDVHGIVMDVTQKRSASLRHEVERVVGETTEHRIGELRKSVEKVVGEVAENRVAGIRNDVEKVVAEAGEQRVQELRKDVANKVIAEMESAIGAKAPEAPVTALLDSALCSIQESTSQTDILRALLDGAAHFSSRVALLVIKGDSCTGWQARGFDDNGAIKKLSVSTSDGLAGKAVQSRATTSGAASEMEGKFVSNFGEPSKGEVSLLPLLVRDKVPALLYADSGTRADGECDIPALQLLIRSAGLWLEILTLRKATASSPSHETGSIEVSPPPAAEEHAHEAAAAAGAAATATHAHEPAHAAAHSNGADDEVHKKAKRFAKLLVDEIKLYNQQKVNEGRAHKDLYNRLKDDIEKSRASYEKRYGNTAAAASDYFMQEVIRVLAENDVAVLGSAFPR